MTVFTCRKHAVTADHRLWACPNTCDMLHTGSGEKVGEYLSCYRVFLGCGEVPKLVSQTQKQSRKPKSSTLLTLYIY